MIDDFLTISMKKPIIADLLLQPFLFYFNFHLLLSTSLFEKKHYNFGMLIAEKIQNRYEIG